MKKWLYLSTISLFTLLLFCSTVQAVDTGYVSTVKAVDTGYVSTVQAVDTGYVSTVQAVDTTSAVQLSIRNISPVGAVQSSSGSGFYYAVYMTDSAIDKPVKIPI